MTTSTQVNGWLTRQTQELSKDPDYVAEGLALRLIEDVLRKMDMEGMTASELAEKMGVSRAYVSKVLNAPPNLTLRSLAAVALALNAKPRVSLIYQLAPITGLPDANATLIVGPSSGKSEALIFTTQESDWYALKNEQEEPEKVLAAV